MCEELVLRDGAVVTAHLGEYKLPTVKDVPTLTTVHVPAAGRGSFGLKAVGEISNAALPAAIANAVYDAVGVRLTSTAGECGKIFSALRNKNPTNPT